MRSKCLGNTGDMFAGMMVLSLWMKPICGFWGVVGDPTSLMGVPTGVLRGVAKGVRGVPAGTNGSTWMGGPERDDITQ